MLIFKFMYISFYNIIHICVDISIIFIPSSYYAIYEYLLAHTGGDGVIRSLLLRHYHLHKEKIFFFCATV
jgi:hypothetical protein